MESNNTEILALNPLVAEKTHIYVFGVGVITITLHHPETMAVNCVEGCLKQKLAIRSYNSKSPPFHGITLNEANLPRPL